MKYKILVSFFSVVFATSILWSQTTSIPDANFENYLETHDINGNEVNLGDATSMGDGVDTNGLVFTDRINSVIVLSISNLNINTLVGIEGFDSLETLICNGNNLINLDVSNNANLISLLCGSNQLSGLDIRSNLNLVDLDCSSNQIPELILQEGNVAGNPSLKSLTCSNNRLTSIDVSQNTNLTLLSVSSNQLIDLFVNNNTNLESLFCASNQISTLNLSANSNLKTLDVSNNLISNLDLSAINTNVCPDPQTDPLTSCQGISFVNVANNHLTTLNVANGYNDLISSFNSQSNPDLFCVQVDASFVPTSNWQKADWTYFSDATCLDIYTYVPDDEFEQALIALSLDDVLDNLVLTSNISFITTLNVSNSNINSLIGIEDFGALRSLDCSTNSIEEIDLSNSTDLTDLNCSENNMASLNLSNNSNLIILDVSDNILTDLDLNNNLSISNLNCSNNSIIAIDLSNHFALTDFNCESNALEILNLKNGQNGILNNFSAINNANLSCIETDTGTIPVGVTWNIDATASYAVNCGTYVPDNGFEQAIIDAGLDIGPLDNYVPTANIIGETNLDASGYGITDLTGIEDFDALAVFDCSDNNIIELNLTTNTALTSVICNDNALEFLDVRNGTNNAQLVTFDATNNPNLFCINVDDSIYSENAAGWQEDVNITYNIDCQNNRYTLIPDNNFEQALVDLGIDTVPNDNQVLTSNIEYITSLNVNSKYIESLVGIKAFLTLTELDCGNNYLSELDVSNMVNLEDLFCSSNYFLTNNIANPNGLLNTTGTTSLRKLFCANNSLSDLNISLNLNLEELDCSNNNLNNLDISSNNNLIDVNCNNNKISNLSSHTINNNSLKILSCNNNELSALIVNRYLALTTLNCSSNALTLLNITSNGSLEILDFSGNELADIDLSGKNNLISVSGSENQITDVNDLTSPLLESLIMGNNQISELSTVLNNLLAIKYLSVNNNQLIDLNVSSNTSLIELNVNNNELASLQLSADLNQLKAFNCSDNMLVGDFDLSTMGTGTCPLQNTNNPLDFCPDSIKINVSNNQLTFVNIQNGVNNNITNFYATNNPNLNCIQVDDVNIIGDSWQKDATTEYSLDCRFGETYVPDDEFEQALIALMLDSGPLDDYVLTTNIETLISLDISGNAISDLTGLKDFIALQNLNFSNNTITEVDLSQNIDLTQINCSSNSLVNLDLSNNTNITNLNISDNLFVEFDASILPALRVFNCNSNQMVGLDFQLNSLLTDLNCQSNTLEILNLRNGQNANLTNLNAQSNVDLTCIETDTGAAPGGVTWLKDAMASYSTECHYGETYVPDDAFEQALINLGHDSGTLDDYVTTSNINTISFLDVSNQSIADLSGIQDFLGLTNLIIEGNTISIIDLTTNINLVNLNASSNEFTSINLLLNTNLEILNLANNSLSDIDLGSNISLLDLNVSANTLTSLTLNTLVNLKKLNCSENLLDELNATLNPNLVNLYCQFNLFVSDQLNIQNGANESLKIFNATNNPDLRCVLVDDPITVITNVSGDYDGWFIDATANYQSICNDADNDGVANADDQCPSTPFGDPVDLFGCSVLSLPNNNFTILIIGETCLNNNNGKINISTLEYFNYRISLISDDFNKDYHFTNDINILNLLAGTYRLCITIDEWPAYESCYDIVISQPEPLNVTTGKSSNGKKVSINMSGNSNYNVDFNGLKFTTNDSELTLSLQKGTNTIKVNTDLECQGFYEENIFIGEHMFVYPNPFQEKINIHLGEIDKESIKVNLYSFTGQLVSTKAVFNYKSNKINIDTSLLVVGIYTVSVQTKSSLTTFKIVKR